MKTSRGHARINEKLTASEKMRSAFLFSRMLSSGMLHTNVNVFQCVPGLQEPSQRIDFLEVLKMLEHTGTHIMNEDLSTDICG